MNRLRFALTAPLLALLLLLTPAWAEDVSDLRARLTAAGAHVVEVQPSDPRLRDGKVTVGVGPDGRVEVYLPSGRGGVRTPLKTPTERMSLEEFRRLTGDMRRVTLEVTGVEVGRVVIAGSSTGIPFTDPNGQVRTFDRQGPRMSDYDGAFISEGLYDKIAQEHPRTLRGATTGKRTAPDPIPALREAFQQVSQDWGRKVAAMVYANQAEFDKRMTLLGFEVGVNVMLEPGPEARYVLPTRAELLGALLEAKTLEALSQGRTRAEALTLLEQARGGQLAAERVVNPVRRAQAESLAELAGLNAVDKATFVNEALRLAPPQPFVGERAGQRGPLQPWAGSEDRLRDVFAEVREVARRSALERVAGLGAAAGQTLTVRAGALAETALEIERTNGLLIEFVPERNSVRISTGLLNELERLSGPQPEQRAARNKALALLFAHELGHAGGLVAERVADREAIRVVERAEQLRTVSGQTYPLTAQDVRNTLALFSSRSLGDLLRAVRELPRYGTPGGRERAMLGALRGEADPLARYRRADGTLRWDRLSADKALQQGAGVAHFALALFLKELAVVVQTGDRARIEEFFDGLTTTDFYVHYGLFSAGAQAGNVAYSRFLARHIKPRFVSSVLRTNVVLASGLLLPELVQGRFHGKAFAIDLASLGISATAVQGAMAGIRGVVDLRRGEAATRLARAGQGLTRLAKVGGWFYTVAETAVVLYVADELSAALEAAWDERAARDRIWQASAALAHAARDPEVTAAETELRIQDLQAAHEAWRQHLLGGVAAAEAAYEQRLALIARKAKRLADKRTGLIEAAQNGALADEVRSRFETLEAWADSLLDEDVTELERDLARAMQTLETAREQVIREAYQANRRDDDYLAGVDLADGSLLGRLRARWATRGVSENRLEAYRDEQTLLERVRDETSDPAKRAALDDAIAYAQALAEADAQLTVGVREVLERSLEGVEAR